MSFKIPENTTPTTFNFSIESLESVANFWYLGYQISGRQKSAFLDSRVQAAHAAFTRKRRILTRKSGSLSCRVALIESLVRTTVLYFYQTWDLHVAGKERLDCVYRSFLDLERFQNEVLGEVKNERIDTRCVPSREISRTRSPSR